MSYIFIASKITFLFTHFALTSLSSHSILLSLSFFYSTTSFFYSILLAFSFMLLKLLIYFFAQSFNFPFSFFHSFFLSFFLSFPFPLLSLTSTSILSFLSHMLLLLPGYLIIPFISLTSLSFLHSFIIFLSFSTNLFYLSIYLSIYLYIYIYLYICIVSTLPVFVSIYFSSVSSIFLLSLPPPLFLKPSLLLQLLFIFPPLISFFLPLYSLPLLLLFLFLFSLLLLTFFILIISRVLFSFSCHFFSVDLISSLF
ncbi:unnamed protein product [Acanthosepion pharaonis]|uniref:Uncharacterized protein n=1 Tax=Acanthosepion pharaonis TaxID=158019 RepID=A0A812EJ04_ACAPH|nr:unnamed protein product [Sepia pharaonis]